jgi:tellurite methyltransferase
MVWEDIYKKSKAIWGLRSDSLLMELAPSVPMGCVLDLGMGEGRNSLPFAAQGYELIGFDTAPIAIQKALDRAQEMQVSIEASVQDIRGLEIAANRFSLVISTMTLQFMKSAESQAILERITDGLEAGGFVYITVFSTEDPMYQRLKATQPAIEKTPFSQKT